MPSKRASRGRKKGG